MELDGTQRTLKVELWKARRWYNGDNEALREIALLLFTEEELLGETKYKEIKKKREHEWSTYKQSNYEDSIKEDFKRRLRLGLDKF